MNSFRLVKEILHKKRLSKIKIILLNLLFAYLFGFRAICSINHNLNKETCKSS